MITAIVLAAGLSTRMGKQKMLLPWGDTTVLGKVIQTLGQAELADIRVITGGNHKELEDLLQNRGVSFVVNEDYTNGEMLNSIQVGLQNITAEFLAALVVLGDQPQIEARVVKLIIERYITTLHPIIVPSYKMHRGHPWLLGKPYWQEVLDLKPPQTLRNFLNHHNKEIDYIEVLTPSIIQDLDTMEDFSRFKP
jgi:molybdenum cofactor cytidylyltransferase